jgi:hypothetical protein
MLRRENSFHEKSLRKITRKAKVRENLKKTFAYFLAFWEIEKITFLFNPRAETE